MQNKPNFNFGLINVSSFMTSKYVELDASKGRRKQTQTNPVQIAEQANRESASEG